MTPILCNACRSTVPADVGACPACGAFVPPPVVSSDAPLPDGAPERGPGSIGAAPPSLDAGKTPALTKRQIAGEALWLLLMFGTYWATSGRTAGDSNPLGPFLVQCVGCYFVAIHRGRSVWWTAVGLLPVLCLALPFVLPTRNPAGPPRLHLVPRIVLALVTIIAAMGVVVTSASAHRDGPAQPAPASDWRRQDVAGVRIEAPVVIDRDAKAMEQLPAEARAMVADYAMVSGTTVSGSFGVTVIRQTLAAGYDAPFDGALESAVANVAQALGAQVLHVTETPREVDGLDGRHVEAALRHGNVTIRIDGVLVRAGQTTWTIVVKYRGTAATRDARRVLMSVKVPRDQPK